MKPKLVLVGNGMAGVRTLEELLKRDPGRYDITVFGDEPLGNYNRILLSPVLAGERTIEEIITHPLAWYAERGIRLIAGDAVVAIDRKARTISTASGHVAHYDWLLLATGSRPFMPAVPGADRPGVLGFRDIADVARMLAASREYRRAVVIGGGLLGLEAAVGLLKRGMEVTVVHRGTWLMERQLDQPAAALLQKDLEGRGLRVLLKADTSAILGDQRVESLQLKDARELATDLVVVAAGIVPNIRLAQDCGLECGRGIIVDDTLRSSDPRIFAVGECVQHREVCYGLVAPLWEQAVVCADHLLRRANSVYLGSLVSTKLKVTGINIFSAGNFLGGTGTDELVLRDPRRGVYKKLVLREGRLDGAVLVGDTGDGGWYFDLIQQKTLVAHWRQKLVFGRAYCQAQAA